MKPARVIFTFLTICLFLTACTAKPAPGALPSAAGPAVEKAEVKMTPTSNSVSSDLFVKLAYHGNAQVEIINQNAQRILIDVYNPDALSSPATAQDILLTTHTHPDHIKQAFYSVFPGQQLFVKAGSIEVPGVKIRGIPSAHNEGNPFKDEGGTNYIFLIETGGLRIAHFGDNGQDAFTPEQLQQLGAVDVAISQLNNSYSGVNLENKKGFNQMAQIKPRLLIPTHMSMETARHALSLWSGQYSGAPFVTLSAQRLDAKTQLLVLGQQNEPYKTTLNLPDSGF